MLGAQLQKANLPAIFGPNSLAISFAPEYNSAYEHCCGSGNVQRLETALRTVTGQSWTVRFEKQSGPGHGVNGSAGGIGPQVPPPRVRVEETMQQQEILRRAIEVFDARPLFLDAGFGTESAASSEAPAPDSNENEEA